MFGDHWFFKIKLKPFIMAFKAVYILASNDFVASSTSLYHTQCSNIVGATTHLLIVPERQVLVQGILHVDVQSNLLNLSVALLSFHQP